MSVVPSIPQRTQSNTRTEHLQDHNNLHAHTHDEFEPIGSSSLVGILGIAQRTSDQTGITTEVDLTGLSVAVTVAANRYIKITAHVRISSPSTNDLAELKIKEGATVFAIDRVDQGSAAGFRTLHAEVVIAAPSVGPHTYKLTLVRDTGTGNLTSVAGPTFPAFILVEDIGPV